MGSSRGIGAIRICLHSTAHLPPSTGDRGPGIVRDQVRRFGSEDGAPVPVLLEGSLDEPINEVGVGDAAASRLRQGPTPAMRSVLYNPMMDSAQICSLFAPGGVVG